MITTANYFEQASKYEKKFNSGLKAGHDVMKDLKEAGLPLDNTGDNDVDDVVRLQIAQLNKLASEKPAAKKATVKKKPAKKTQAPKVKKRKAVKVKPRKKKAKAVKAKPAPVKYPVTVKRFSKELQIIKRFTNLDGKEIRVKSLVALHKSTVTLLQGNPDRKSQLNDISQRLKYALATAEKNSLTHIKVDLEKEVKADLVANIKSAQPKMKVEYLAGNQKKSPALNGVDDALFQNINNIDEQTKDTFRLKGDIGVLLGDMEAYKLAMSVEGDQGAGKTQFAFQLADAFADIKTVGMFQLEIGAASNIILRNRDLYIKSSNLNRIAIAGEAPNGIDTIRDYAKKFEVIIIDSWTKLDVDSSEFDKLRNDFPDTIWIVLFQRTSGNKIRGGTKPLFDAGINIEVNKVDDTFVNNYAVATKNRYGQTGLKYNISKKEILTLN